MGRQQHRNRNKCDRILLTLIIIVFSIDYILWQKVYGGTDDYEYQYEYDQEDIRRKEDITQNQIKDDPEEKNQLERKEESVNKTDKHEDIRRQEDIVHVQSQIINDSEEKNQPGRKEEFVPDKTKEHITDPVQKHNDNVRTPK